MIARLIEWVIRLWGGAEQREKAAERMADIIARERDAEDRSPGTIDQMADDARRGKL